MVQLVRSDSAGRGAVRPNRSSVVSMFERQTVVKTVVRANGSHCGRAARFAKCLVKWVELRGIEPLTYSMRTSPLGRLGR
jgi:hypothetical protein